jgi:transcription elongation GreA/GreB family factor
MDPERMESLLEAHRSGDLDRMEELWLEMVESVPADARPLIGIVDELKEWGESDRALVMLEVLVGPLREAERWDDLIAVLKRIVAIEPAKDDLGPDFAACYKHLNEDCESIDLFIEKSRLRFARPIGPALAAMEVFLAYRPGEVVLHASGWGIGRVKGTDPLDAMLIIDFDDRKGHKINPASAPKLLKKLDPEDFRALKVLDPERLDAMVKDDPVDLLKRVLSARGRKATPAKIKAALVPGVIPAKSWTSWWSKTRRAAERDPMVRCAGSGASATYSLRKVPEDPRQEALAAFRTSGDRLKRSRLALEARRSVHAAKIVPALIEAIKALPAENDAARAENHFLLVALGEENPGKIDPDSYRDPASAIRILTGIEHPELRALAFDAIRKVPMDERARFLEDAFYKVTPDLWDTVFGDLGQLGEDGRVRQARIVSSLVLHPRSEPDRFGWLVAGVLKGKVEAQDLPDSPTLIRKLVDAIIHLHRHHAGDNDYRDRLQRMQSPLTARDGALLDAVLDHCTPEEARGLRDRFVSCLAFTENLKRELSVRVSRRHSLARPAAEDEPAAFEEDALVSSDVLWATEAGLNARRMEYEKLVNEDIPRGQQALNEAASHGDLSENAEWTYALEQQDQMTKRAERMESEFSRARVIDEALVPLDKMGIGSRGRFQDLESGETVCYTILGPWEVDPDQGILSYDSPVARKILNRRIGEEVTIELPSRRMELKLVALENGLVEEGGQVAK